ncbi:GumC family protein [Devosia sp. 63-57]|uniref:GumC family protein n=1 Tax=Devosia sp. 63-57 TaxID=1895751 RepID=UPI000869ED84|nr:GumC family protein [Devosia sp. 63-57]ODT50122.1 MAG: hypothetical protein ABS74_04125 [Pelagibacterium sp. SCN 63-126]ODU87412.1 MAG: hypothetical protein ABT14_05425 [Pelagibacterium sp. SCN 63-17]OJX44864.1 MAG: hypothetical protein BGO80_03125 [Devosia sp. 63-57]
MTSVHQSILMSRPKAAEPPKPETLADRLAGIDAWTALGWVKRFWWIAAGCAFAGVFAGYSFGTLVPARYTTYADILLYTSVASSADDPMFGQGQARDAQLLTAESRNHVLSSGNVMARAVADLDLANDPEFAGTSGSDEDRQLAARRTLTERVTTTRGLNSLMTTLSVWAESPEKAVAVSNGVVAAFQAELAAMDANSVDGLTRDISTRLADLRRDVLVAEEAVEAYRSENRLEATNGESLDNQSIAQVNTELNTARSRLADAQARQVSLETAFANGNAASPELASEAIAALRAQESEVVRQLDSLSARLGPRHPEIQALQPQVEAIRAQIRREIERQVSAARADVQQAQALVDGLTAQVAQSRSSISQSNTALVTLREMEREAEVRRGVYQAFLSQLTRVQEMSNVNTSGTQVISAAVPPESRSYPPRTSVLAAGGGFAGLMFGLACAAGLGLLLMLGKATKPASRKP